MTNKIATRTISGLYVVIPGRALHWPCKDAKPMIWAKAGEVVDLTHRFLAEVANSTGQMHKLAAVESVPAGARFIDRNDLPSDIRVRMDLFDNGQPAEPAPINLAEQARTIDLDALPSAAAVEEAPEPTVKRAKKKTSKKPASGGLAENPPVSASDASKADSE